jgi:hypothetical protein
MTVFGNTLSFGLCAENFVVMRIRKDPVIIVGMHHSGTSLLTRIIALGGLFMIRDMGHDETKLFTIWLNDTLLMRGQWYRNPILSVSEVLALKPLFTEFLSKQLESYFKANGYSAGRRWGFKDPRASVLLPLYLDAFPEATVVHISRDPQNVAASLARRRQKGIGLVQDLEFWKALQAQHIERVRSCEKEIPGRYYELEYEELCSEPMSIIRRLFTFLGLTLNEEVEAFAKKKIKPPKVYTGAES